MAQVTKNAFKGYSFQEYVYLLFACLMDLNSGIISIDAEIDKLRTEANHNFDDIKIVTKTEKLFIQVKNYKNLLFSDIKVNADDVSLGDNKSLLKSGYKNIVILNEIDVESNTELFGLKAFKSGEVYLISLSVEYVSDFIDSLFHDDRRVKELCNFIRKRLFDGEFLIESSELPLHKVYNQKLKSDTIHLRNIVFQKEAKTFFVVGKPGVGKSHFVNEFCKEIDKKLIYRFWIDSQDSELQARLQYSNFLKDLSYRVFKKSGKYTEQQIIDKIKELNLTLIIDGLDHVENYNNGELEKFFNFISMLKKIRVIVLTRPLKHDIDYEIFNLENWDYHQTKRYLEICYGINNKGLHQEIFKITNGYPIITYYVANHYLIHNKLVATDKIEEVNDYYNLLISDANILSAITIFLVCNSFLSKSEIEYLSSNPLLTRIIFEFIESYPYLFEVSLDRYSLIHDSFYRYLLSNNNINSEEIKCFYERLLNSLRNSELRFLNRFNCLYISDDDKRFILEKYSDFDAFNDLLKDNWDIEAIKEFYVQLDHFVKLHEVVLDHYQYYSLILIQECCSRIELSYNLDLFYQQINYLIKHSQNHISSLFSNGVAYKIFKSIMTFEDDGNFIIDDNIYLIEEGKDVEEFIEIHKNEKKLQFLLAKEIFEYEAYFKNVLNRTHLEIDEEHEAVSFIIAYLYINDTEFLGMNKLFSDFISRKNIEDQIQFVNKEISSIGISYVIDVDLLRRVKYLLYKTGYLEEGNPYLNISLDYKNYEEEITDIYDAATYVANTIRLSILCGKKMDINVANRCYITMAYEKDNSFVMLPEALEVFEKYNVLDEDESINILSNLVEVTSDQYFLLSSYVNIKGAENVDRLLKKRSENMKFDFNLFSLQPNILDKVPFSIVRSEIFGLMKHKSYKIIEKRDMENVLQSTHAENVLTLLDKFGFKIFDTTTKTNSNLLYKKPEEKGYIGLEDLEYIKSINMSYLEIAKFPDGYYQCFSNMELFKHFNLDDVRRDYLSIINESMKCKGVISDRRLSYNMYLGNIPKLIEWIRVPCDWEKMRKILLEYLRLSFNYKEDKI